MYGAYDAAGAASGAWGGAERAALPEALESAEEAAALLARCRNDLEAPAVGLVPEVGEVLDMLRGEP